MFSAGSSLFSSATAAASTTAPTSAPAQSGFTSGSGFQAGAKAQGFNFPAPPTSTSSIQGGAVPSGFSFGGQPTATTTQQSTFNFVGTATPAASTPAAAPAAAAAATTTSTFSSGIPSTGFSMLPSSNPAFNYNPAGATSTAVPTASTNTTLAPSTGSIGFASKPPAAISATSAATSKPTFSFPTTSLSATSSSTPATTGLSLAVSSTSASTTGTTGIFSLATTSTATTSSSILGGTAPAAEVQMNFRQLEEQINKWMLELEEQEKAFLQQATQVNAWDRLLLDNGEKIHQLNHDVDRVKIDQQRLDNELDFIRSQQKELEDLLTPLETSMEQLPPLSYQHHADIEREHTYQLAESIDGQLKRMVLDLKEIIDHLNTTNSTEENTDPIHQITKILNAHMDSLRWIDQNAGLLNRRVEDISKQMELQRKEQERNYRLVYN